MNRRFIVVTNWVTGRYFKQADIEDFFRNITYLERRGIPVSPSIRISPPTKTRKTPDIFLCTGASSKAAKSRAEEGKLILTYEWNEFWSETYELIDEKEIMKQIKRKDGKINLTNAISNHLLKITEDSVELRNIR